MEFLFRRGKFPYLHDSLQLWCRGITVSSARILAGCENRQEEGAKSFRHIISLPRLTPRVKVHFGAVEVLCRLLGQTSRGEFVGDLAGLFRGTIRVDR
jgi:hypothetical protein